MQITTTAGQVTRCVKTWRVSQRGGSSVWKVALRAAHFVRAVL
jgi:hypothetical protein